MKFKNIVFRMMVFVVVLLGQLAIDGSGSVFAQSTYDEAIKAIMSEPDFQPSAWIGYQLSHRNPIYLAKGRKISFSEEEWDSDIEYNVVAFIVTRGSVIKTEFNHNGEPIEGSSKHISESDFHPLTIKSVWTDGYVPEAGDSSRYIIFPRAEYLSDSLKSKVSLECIEDATVELVFLNTENYIDFHNTDIGDTVLIVLLMFVLAIIIVVAINHFSNKSYEARIRREKEYKEYEALRKEKNRIATQKAEELELKAKELEVSIMENYTYEEYIRWKATGKLFPEYDPYSDE